MKFSVITIVLIVFAITAATGQTTVKSGDRHTDSDAPALSADNNLSFYMSEDENTYYIDFESINITISDIIIKNTSGKTVFKDDVRNLPVDAIYELDVSDYASGSYTVELKAYTGSIKKNIRVK